MACSIVGASGNAVPGGALLQLRALDWGVGAPVSAYPLLTVYHPSNGVMSLCFCSIFGGFQMCL